MAINCLQVLKKIGNAIVSLQNKKMSKEQFNNIMNKSYVLADNTNMTKKGKWTIGNGKVYLLENLLSVYVYATRSPATGAGDITNEEICTFTITDERITYIPSYWGVYQYLTGGVNLGYLSASKTGDHTWDFTVSIRYTHAALTSTRYKFQLPITIDVTKY